jgi:soluble lytic murein transglycosylase
LLGVPTIRLPDSGSRVKPALVLAVIRQESEFDPTAISAAGARGLMQLMPASARAAAATLKIPYRAPATTEAQYNVRLGSAHLADYIGEFGGSYLLGIAAYNAGPDNVRRWIETNGDPRKAEVDTIDWIELIPFGETRNYVQRVLESLQVYRYRLTGMSQALAFDLERPNPLAPDLAHTPPSMVAGPMPTE